MLPSGELFEEPSARDGRWDGSTVAGAVTNRTADFKSGTGEHFEGARRHRGTCSGRDESHRSDLNRRPLDYESSALPLSYCGRSTELLWPINTAGAHGGAPPNRNALARIRTATPFGTTPSR